MAEIVRTIEEAVAAVLDVRTLETFRKIPGSSDAVQQVLYDTYGKGVVDAEVERQVNRLVGRSS